MTPWRLICPQEWELWSHSIVQAVQSNSALPAPPMDSVTALATSSPLRRVLEASAKAAAALARQGHGRNAEIGDAKGFLFSNWDQRSECGWFFGKMFWRSNFGIHQGFCVKRCVMNAAKLSQTICTATGPLDWWDDFCRRPISFISC